MKSFVNSQDALLWLMTNRFDGQLLDKNGNRFYHGKSNTIIIEYYACNDEGLLELNDIDTISYEDFVKDYDGVNLDVIIDKNI